MLVGCDRMVVAESARMRRAYPKTLRGAKSNAPARHVAFPLQEGHVASKVAPPCDKVAGLCSPASLAPAPHECGFRRLAFLQSCIVFKAPFMGRSPIAWRIHPQASPGQALASRSQLSSVDSRHTEITAEPELRGRAPGIVARTLLLCNDRAGTPGGPRSVRAPARFGPS